jgi:hypothetical protein
LNVEEVRSLLRSNIEQRAEKLSTQDINFLIDTLTEKDDTLRYNSFLLLQANSRLTPNVYAHWNIFEDKLGSSNSYQRSLGIMLLAENIRWDKENKFGKTIDKYLNCCMDEKFITARQAIQGLAKTIEASNSYNAKISEKLNNLNYANYKENQQKLLKKDVTAILKLLDKKAML